MFEKKIKSLNAIKGIAAEDITAEQLQAVNTELAEMGVNVVVAANVEQEETNNDDALTAAQARISALETEMADNATQLTASQAEVERLKHENASLKNSAGADATEKGNKEDKIENPDAESKDFDFETSASAQILRDSGIY